MVESGLAIHMLRIYGYSDKGSRSYGLRNGHEKGRVNTIGVLLQSCLLTVMLLSGSINADTFHEWLCHDLLPKLRIGSVMVREMLLSINLATS